MLDKVKATTATAMPFAQIKDTNIFSLKVHSGQVMLTAMNLTNR